MRRNYLLIVTAVFMASCASTKEREAFYKSPQGKLQDNEARNLIMMRECGPPFHVKNGVIHCGFDAGEDPAKNNLRMLFPTMADSLERAGNRQICDVMLEKKVEVERQLGKLNTGVFSDAEQSLIHSCEEQARVKALLKNVTEVKRRQESNGQR